MERDLHLFCSSRGGLDRVDIQGGKDASCMPPPFATLQVTFRKRAMNYEALLTYENKELLFKVAKMHPVCHPHLHRCRSLFAKEPLSMRHFCATRPIWIRNDRTGWPRRTGCLIFSGHFLQKSPKISGSLTHRDLQLQAFYASWPPCSDDKKKRMEAEEKVERNRRGEI